MAVAATVVISLPAAATPAPDEELFVVAQDGSFYGILGDVVESSASAVIDQLGALPADDSDEGVEARVTAVDLDPATGDAIALISVEANEDYACFFVRIDGDTAEYSEDIVPLTSVEDGQPVISTSPCTGFDLFSAEVITDTSAVDGLAESLAPGNEAETLAIVSTAEGLIWLAGIESGEGQVAAVIEDAPEAPLEALDLVFVEDGPGVLLLAYGGTLVPWLSGFGDFVDFGDLVPGTIVGLDVTDDLIAWFTWIDESGQTPSTRLGSIDLTEVESQDPVSAPAEGVSLISLTPAVDREFGAITLDGAAVTVEAIAVVPAGFGEVASEEEEEELAATGANSDAVAALGVVAGVFGVLGLLAIALRLALRRRVA